MGSTYMQINLHMSTYSKYFML